MDAKVGALVVSTDQPRELGGAGSAVSPFDLFLASLATCAGFYVLAFFQARSLPTEGLGLRQHVDYDPTTKAPSRIRIELQLPANLPEAVRAGAMRAAEACKVKKAILAAPSIEVIAVAGPVTTTSPSV